MPRLTLIGLLFCLLTASPVVADPRPFTFTYDAYPEGKGNVEYEQWVTFQRHTDNDSDFTRLAFRHEFEIGVADNFDLSLYVASWSYEDSDERTGTHFDESSIEGIVYLTNPVTDPVGIGLYAEFVVGEDALEFEQKLILHKDIGNWTFAYNLVLETELEGVFNDEKENEVEGVIGHDFGIAYSLSPAWRVGGELTVESIFDDWSHYEDTVVYLGPAISYQGGRFDVANHNLGWWVTLTPAFQVTSVDDEPDFQVRLIAALEF